MSRQNVTKPSLRLPDSIVRAQLIPRAFLPAFLLITDRKGGTTLWKFHEIGCTTEPLRWVGCLAPMGRRDVHPGEPVRLDRRTNMESFVVSGNEDYRISLARKVSLPFLHIDNEWAVHALLKYQVTLAVYVTAAFSAIFKPLCSQQNHHHEQNIREVISGRRKQPRRRRVWWLNNVKCRVIEGFP